MVVRQAAMQIHVSIQEEDGGLPAGQDGSAHLAVVDGRPECLASVVITVTGVDRRNLPNLDAETLARLAEVFTHGPHRAALHGADVAGERRRAPAAPPHDDVLDRLVVKHSGRILFIKTCDVDWIEAEGNYVLIHCGKANYSLRETIGSLETQLDPARFRRIHRSTIVNVDRIKELRTQARGDYRVILDSGAQLTLSRSYRETLHRLLRKSL